MFYNTALLWQHKICKYSMKGTIAFLEANCDHNIFNVLMKHHINYESNIYKSF